MEIAFWISASDRKLLEKYPQLGVSELKPYLDGLLTGKFGKPGSISAIDKSFVLGRRGIRKIKDCEGAEGEPYVHIKNHSLYPEGLMFAPESWIDVKYHRKTTTID